MAEIRRAYRILVQKYHPDVNPDPSAAIIIREVNEAYEVLSDPQKKIEYDNKLINPYQQQTPVTEQRPHRDPRYRKRTTRPVSNHYTQAELMQQYLPYMLWLCWGGILFVAILFTDKILPSRTIVDEITGIYQVSTRRGAYMYDIIETGNGMNIKMYDREASYFYNERKINVTDTPILRIPTSVSGEDGNHVILLGVIYRTLVFLPLLLLTTSVLGILFRKKVEFSFSLTVVSGILLVINIYLI